MEGKVLAMVERTLPAMEGSEDGSNRGRNLEVGGLEDQVLTVPLCI